MTAIRATILTLASLPLAGLASPAMAQVDETVVLEIMRQCARIDDATARLACYDNNVRVGNVNNPRPAVPGAMPRPLMSSPAPAGGSAGGATGFGHEDIVNPDRFQTPAGELDELSARVTNVQQVGQGMYLMTLEDGAQWQFSETVDFAYRPPRSGSTIEITRASLGSFLMIFDHQRSVRVRRIR